MTERLIDRPEITSALIDLVAAKRDYADRERSLASQDVRGLDLAYYLEGAQAAVDAAEAALESALQALIVGGAVCESCGSNVDVRQVIDPYQEAINNRRVYVKYCPACRRESHDSI